MGYHIDSEREKDLREAYDGPVVSAAPGYSLLDEKQPNGEPQRVIACQDPFWLENYISIISKSYSEPGWLRISI